MRYKYLKALILIGLFISHSLLIAQQFNKSLWDKIELLQNRALELTTSNIDSAESIELQLFELIEEPVDSAILSDIYSLSAVNCFIRGNFEYALENNLKALEIREAINDTLRCATSLNNIGNIYYYTDAFDKAINYHKKSISLRRLKSQFGEIAINYNSIGLVYSYTEEYDSAIKFFQLGFESLKNSLKPNDKTKAKLLANIGGLYHDMELYDLAIENLEKALAIDISNNLYSTATWDLMKLGNIYLQTKEYPKAIAALKEADSLSQFASTLEVKNDINYFTFRYYLEMGNTDSTAKYLDIYNSLNDSIISMKTEQNIADMEAKYQLEKKEAALALSKEKSARLSGENRISKLLLLISIIGLLVLGIVFFVAYRSMQQRRRLSKIELELKEREMSQLLANQESAALNSMLKGQEEERERIAKDLHDNLGGTLAALKLGLRKKENKVASEDLEMVERAVKEVRNIAHNLSSGLLEKQGFGIALRELSDSIESSGLIKFNLFLQSGLAKIGQEAALELYRIVQELTNNTIKHADATEINLQTNQNEQTFNLIFEDNGKGFDPDLNQEGMGMRNMRARLQKINGNLHIDSQPGRGTIVIIEIESKK